MKKIVIASGGFDPIHRGHIDYLRRASLLGNKLIVILNKDEFLINKKGYKFYSIEDRLAIIENLWFVDDTFISIDKDNTVCDSLRYLNKKYYGNELIFAKGGDRHSTEIPEAQLCRELGIKIVDGLGDKTESSSALVNVVSLCLYKGVKR